MLKDNNKSLNKAIGASYTILGSLSFFGFGGYLLDDYFGENNFWLIVGLLLGVVIGLYELAKYILKN